VCLFFSFVKSVFGNIRIFVIDHLIKVVKFSGPMMNENALLHILQLGTISYRDKLEYLSLSINSTLV
jgi:hypothetical protein